MRELRNQLEFFLRDVDDASYIIQKIKSEKSIFPFSVEGKILAYLLSINKIDYDQYLQLSRDYCNRNKYLDLFDMAPRTFGETWGEKHIITLFPQFIKATKRNMEEVYPNFDGEFDLWYQKGRIEVKACRANSSSQGGSLTSRAYLHNEATAADFKYHYQQLKPSCCDVFIWIGVCRDDLIYWVLTSQELLQTGKLTPQHRNKNTGDQTTEIFEGQVFMTEKELTPFLFKEKDVFNAVCSKIKKIK